MHHIKIQSVSNNDIQWQLAWQLLDNKAWKKEAYNKKKLKIHMNVVVFLRPSVFVWCRTEKLKWTGGAITSTPAQCHLSSVPRDQATSRLDICVWAGVCLSACQMSLEKLTSITLWPLPTPGSVYHKISLMKIHAAETKPKRVSCARFLSLWVCAVSVYMYVRVGLQQDGEWSVHK